MDGKATAKSTLAFAAGVGPVSVSQGGTLNCTGAVTVPSTVAVQNSGLLHVLAGTTNMTGITITTANPGTNIVYGLLEGRTNTNFDTTSPNPGTVSPQVGGRTYGGVQSGTLEAQIAGSGSSNGWQDNSTYIYTGLIYFGGNSAGAGGTVQYNFVEQFDDNVKLVIDGQTVLNDGNWNTPTWGTI